MVGGLTRRRRAPWPRFWLQWCSPLRTGWRRARRRRRNAIGRGVPAPSLSRHARPLPAPPARGRLRRVLAHAPAGAARVQEFVRMRCDEMFDIVRDYPDRCVLGAVGPLPATSLQRMPPSSLPAVQELAGKWRTEVHHTLLVQALHRSLAARLLHRGVETGTLIELYVSMIKVGRSRCGSACACARADACAVPAPDSAGLGSLRRGAGSSQRTVETGMAGPHTRRHARASKHTHHRACPPPPPPAARSICGSGLTLCAASSPA